MEDKELNFAQLEEIDMVCFVSLSCIYVIFFWDLFVLDNCLGFAVHLTCFTMFCYFKIRALVEMKTLINTGKCDFW